MQHDSRLSDDVIAQRLGVHVPLSYLEFRAAYFHIYTIF